MSFVQEIMKKSKMIDFLFPNNFDELMNDEYYDYERFEMFLFHAFPLLDDKAQIEKVSVKGKGDGGADLILTTDAENEGQYRIGIQAKYWKNRVGTGPINQLTSTRKRLGLTHLWIVTTSDLTNDATKIANSEGIHILRRDDVVQMIEKIKMIHNSEVAEKGESRIQFLQLPPVRKSRNDDKPIVRDDANQDSKDLVSLLKEMRIRISQTHSIYPIYQVFSNGTIEELSIKKPKKLSELSDIKGLGEKRIAKFGSDIISFFSELERSKVAETKEGSKDLYQVLLVERVKIAKYNNMLEEDVYSDKTAGYLAKMKPKKVEDLNKIFGFDKHNIEVFGNYLIKVIAKHA